MFCSAKSQRIPTAQAREQILCVTIVYVMYEYLLQSVKNDIFTVHICSYNTSLFFWFSFIDNPENARVKTAGH